MAWTPSSNPATIQKWRERVEAFERSNQPLEEFSDSIGVAHASMRIWRRSLARNPPQLPALIEVKLAAQTSSPPDPTMVVELQAGRRLHLRPGFHAPSVRQLVALLESKMGQAKKQSV